jgi:hypothetical protein
VKLAWPALAAAYRASWSSDVRPPKAGVVLAVAANHGVVASARDVRAWARAAGAPLADPDDPPEE